MSDTKDTTSEAEVVEAPEVDTTGESGEVKETPKSFRDEVAEITGLKEIPDDETARKVVKDMNSYTGKQKDQKSEEAKKEILDSGDFISKERYESDMFFSKNDAYARDKDLIEAIASKNGVSVTEAVELDSYKTVAEKITGFEKSKEGENVLKSNPRITATKDTMEKSRTALGEGNNTVAEDLAVKGVLESLGK